VAVNGRYVYWANYGSGTIARANLDGANVEKRFITGADEPIGIAVDSGHLYWTNAGLDPGSGTIGRANLDGSRVNQHFIKAGNPTGGLAVDTGYVYWTHRYWNHDYTSVGDAIGRANLDGSHVERHFIDASNKLDGVAVNGRYIFWSNNGEDAIGRATNDATAVDQRCLTAKHVPLGNVPEGIAVDGQHVCPRRRSGGSERRKVVRVGRRVPRPLQATGSVWHAAVHARLLRDRLGRGGAARHR
jgi:virginiamycin B lyase